MISFLAAILMGTSVAPEDQSVPDWENVNWEVLLDGDDVRIQWVPDWRGTFKRNENETLETVAIMMYSPYELRRTKNGKGHDLRSRLIFGIDCKRQETAHIFLQGFREIGVPRPAVWASSPSFVPFAGYEDGMGTLLGTLPKIAAKVCGEDE